MEPLARYVCDRCGTTFDAPAARCPKCLRKSSVRETSERGSSDAVRLAAGDQAQSPTARRATALFVAVALSAVLAIAVSLFWDGLVSTELAVPASVAAALGVVALVRAALVTEGWAGFARRSAIGLGLALWAFVSGALALLTTEGISIGFTLLVAGVLFVGGVVGVLRWLQSREQTAPAPTGKWR